MAMHDKLNVNDETSMDSMHDGRACLRVHPIPGHAVQTHSAIDELRFNYHSEKEIKMLGFVGPKFEAFQTSPINFQRVIQKVPIY